MTYSFVILFGCLFNRKKKQIQDAKLNTAEAIGGTIAHELKTPFASMRLIAMQLEEYMPTLINSHLLSVEANLTDDKISEKNINRLLLNSNQINQIVDRSNLTINSLLKNIKSSSAKPADFNEYSICKCVDDMLAEYPFSETEAYIPIHWKHNQDFNFFGSKLLISHVLINILKNALYFILAANKGEITIWVDISRAENYLHIKDTGQGVKQEYLSKMFDKFFSQRKHGTGLGLAFCKSVMENIGGRIECASEEGKYTEFILAFPAISKVK